MTFHEVIAAIDEMGLRIDGGAVPKIHPPKDVRHRKRFQELQRWLREYRQQLLAHFEPPAPRTLCPLCVRDVTDDEDRARLTGVNPFCDWGGIPQQWDRMKEKPIPGKPGCPYRLTDSGNS